MVIVISVISAFYLLTLGYFSSLRLNNTGKLSADDGQTAEPLDAVDIALTILKLLSVIYVFFLLSRSVLSHHLVVPWYNLGPEILSVGLASFIAAVPVSAAVIVDAYSERFEDRAVKLTLVFVCGVILSVMTGIVHVAIAGFSVHLSPAMILNQPLKMGVFAIVLGVIVIAGALVHVRIIKAIVNNAPSVKPLILWDAASFALTTVGAALVSALIWKLF